MSTAVIHNVMLVCTDIKKNENKFWEGTLFANGDVVCRWGRVGAAGQSKTFPGAGKVMLDRKVREKTRDGYAEVPVLGSAKAQVVAATTDAVKSQIQASNNPVIDALLAKLVTENRHEIFAMSGGQIEVQTDGVVKTAVGAIDLSSVKAAREKLEILASSHENRDFSSPAFMNALEDYLTLVPQKVGARRGWHATFLAADDAISRQSAFLDQLESSIEMALQSSRSELVLPQVFDIKLDMLENERQFREIERYFKASLNPMHMSAKLRPVRAYTVQIGGMAKGFEQDGARLANQQRLWHGTRVYNILSIFKHGLIVPKSGGTAVITGRMFGDGLYFSDQSSKALNYSAGFWDSSRPADSRCFMFLADVAMGKPFTPSYYDRREWQGVRKARPGFDSTFARAGMSGVRNNEMIVYRTGQANLTTLVEFSA
jgi:poly [ADP-ribose] polymerase